MGAGAGQTGGGIQAMPQVGQIAPRVPTQSGLGALATQMQQNGQADPRLMAMMQAFQNQGGMPGGQMMGTFGPNDMPVPYDPRKPDSMIPGGVPVQRPLPVGAGGKGAGMPPPGMGVPRPSVPGTMVNPSRPMPKPQTMAPNRRPGFSGFR